MPRRSAGGLRSLRNVGPAFEKDLNLLGIYVVEQLRGADPHELYERLCAKTGSRQDPCVLDTFMAVVHYANTGEALDWWKFTPERKRALQRRQ